MCRLLIGPVPEMLSALGFTASIVKGEDLASAVRFASANSTSVVNKIGAKAGILRESDLLHEMPMEITDF